MTMEREEALEVERVKEPYSKPELVVHGDVSEITRNTGVVQSDGETGASRLDNF